MQEILGKRKNITVVSGIFIFLIIIFLIIYIPTSSFTNITIPGRVLYVIQNIPYFIANIPPAQLPSFVDCTSSSQPTQCSSNKYVCQTSQGISGSTCVLKNVYTPDEIFCGVSPFSSSPSLCNSNNYICETPPDIPTNSSIECRLK